MCQEVLQKNKVGKIYSFSKYRIVLKYLGSVQSTNGRTFKVLNFTFKGSRLNTGTIYIFNNKNQYVGNYELGDAGDLPDELRNGKLVFTNATDHSDCDKKLITTISLKNGLPKMIFIKCKGEFGDLYNFSSND